MRRVFICTVLSVMSLITTAAAARDPQGERANYDLVRDGARTSSVFSSGQFSDEIQDPIRGPEGNFFKTLIQFRVTTILGSSYDSHGFLRMPEEFFEPQFMERLRAGEEYHGPDMKMKHVGFADVTNRDGVRYPHCDKVLLTDLVLSPSMRAALGIAKAPPQDTQILLHYYAGIPALSAVRADIATVQNGSHYRLGFDYRPRQADESDFDDATAAE